MIGKIGGRDSQGHVSVRHRGGGSKRYLRPIDFKQDKKEMTGTVESIEYDPNRNVRIALLKYQDGDRKYILAPEGLKIGEILGDGENVEAKAGNSLPLKNIPIGTPIHNIEMFPGKGSQMVGAPAVWP